MPRITRTERLTLSMDKDLKRRFDVVCSWKEVSMSQIAGQLIEQWLEENTPPGLFDLQKEQEEEASPVKGKGVKK